MSISLFAIIVGVTILISWKNFRPASIIASISLFLILFAYFSGYRGDVSADPSDSSTTETIASVVNTGEVLFWASILLMSVLMFIKLYKAVGQTRKELEKELERLKEQEEDYSDLDKENISISEADKEKDSDKTVEKERKNSEENSIKDKD